MEPSRYKGAHGGRGSAKSHFFAGRIIDLAIQIPDLRVVCLREYQATLKQSSKLLLEDKIRSLGVGSAFEVMENEIRTPGGGMIIFQGMQNHTAESVKSWEGFDIAWFDEAHRASAKSLSLLRPTLRRERGHPRLPKSELWFSWNPNAPNDPVEQILRGENKWPDARVIEANYRDNPWFPEVLREEMQYDKRRDPDRYAHVWMGEYARHSQARVFSNWKVEAFETPADARFYLGADWGFSVDPTVLVRCWIKDRQLFVDYEAWKVGCDIDYTPALFAGTDTWNPPRWQNPYRWSGIPQALKWKIIADSSNPQAISYMSRQGFLIEESIKGIGSVEEGVTFLKGFDIVVHPRCEHVADELASYSYKIDPKTEEVLPQLEDKKNHTIDALRYAVERERRSSYDSTMNWVGELPKMHPVLTPDSRGYQWTR